MKLFSTHHLLSGSQIEAFVPTMDRSTLYRNIRRFVDDGVLREVVIESGKTLYEKNDDEHQHFVCDDCHEVTSFEVQTTVFKKKLPSKVTLRDIEVTVRGVCAQCN